jgi:dihydrofolate synthase/folylpolyglutamate synthase
LAFSLAEAAVEVLVGPSDLTLLDRVSREFAVPGRLESLGGDPEIIFDVAHNPDGIEALAKALPEVVGDRPVVAVFGVLSDKDHASMLEALRSITSEVFLCRPVVEAGEASGRRAVEPVELAEVSAAVGLEARIAEDPAGALALARSEAASRGAVVLVCGSHLLRAALQD